MRTLLPAQARHAPSNFFGWLLAGLGAVSSMTSGLRAQDHALTFRALDEVVRIEAVAGVPWGAIGGAAVSEDGAVAVADNMVRRVVLLSESGEVESVFERTGSGPGEFLAPGKVGFVGDTVWTIDRGQPRVLLYTSTGGAVETLVLVHQPLAPPFRMGPPQALVRGRTLLSELRASPLRSRSMGADLSEVPVVHLDGHGTILNTLALRDISQRAFVLQNESRPWGGLVGAQPFTSTMPWAALPSGAGIVLGVEGGCGPVCFQVTAISLAADTIWSIRHTFAPVHLDRARVDSVAEAWVNDAMASRGFAPSSRREAERAVEGELIVPVHLPSLTGLLPVSDRALFAVRESPAPGEGQRLTFFADGEARFHVRLPPRVRPLAASVNAIWAVAVGAYDEESLVKLAIR